ncbi:TetR family transcriptional regulator C-terminal domain-containing protein [Singulisphaera sp. PoT]|uniref:TetR/AcrR family transcriptional regulator n=1 Tax=Singulisphaera sp. PoT TaxID=3411797 RepID=UPI003BF504BE
MSAERVARASVTTRTDLLAAGVSLILEKGYNQCGIDEILKSVGVHKGSFYHFFKSKEDFGLQVVDYYAEYRLTNLADHLNDEDYPPLERLRRFFEEACRRHQSLGYRKGCLFGNLGQELADQSEAFRMRLEEVLVEYRRKIACCLREAQKAGGLRADFDADRLAGFCLNSWEGAVLRMKVAKNFEPLEDFLFLMFETVLKTSPTDAASLPEPCPRR